MRIEIKAELTANFIVLLTGACLTGWASEAKVEKTADENSNAVIARYHFEKVEDGMFADETGRYPLTIAGGAGKVSEGVVGNAAEFDGTWGAVSEKLKGFACKDGFSVEAWLNFKNPHYTSVMNATSPNPTSDSFHIDIYARLRKRALRFIQPMMNVLLAPAPEFNEWVHVVCVYDSVSGMVKIFKNGELAAQEKASPGETLWFRGPFRVSPGGRQANFGFMGLIDELVLYSRALSGAEAKKRYNETCPKNHNTNTGK